MTPLHCWHPTGQGVTAGNSGWDYLNCCWCDATGIRRWSREERPVDGHGDYYTVPVRVPATEITTDAPVTCPERAVT